MLGWWRPNPRISIAPCTYCAVHRPCTLYHLCQHTRPLRTAPCPPAPPAPTAPPPQVLALSPQLQTLVVRFPSLTSVDPPDPDEPQPPAAARREEHQREALLAAVTGLKVRDVKWGYIHDYDS